MPENKTDGQIVNDCLLLEIEQRGGYRRDIVLAQGMQDAATFLSAFRGEIFSAENLAAYIGHVNGDGYRGRFTKEMAKALAASVIGKNREKTQADEEMLQGIERVRVVLAARYNLGNFTVLEGCANTPFYRLNGREEEAILLP